MVAKAAVHGGQALRVGLAMTEYSPRESWLLYLAIDGTREFDEFMAYLEGRRAWPAVEHDRAARALNDYIFSQGLEPPVAYAEDLLTGT